VVLVCCLLEDDGRSLEFGTYMLAAWISCAEVQIGGAIWGKVTEWESWNRVRAVISCSCKWLARVCSSIHSFKLILIIVLLDTVIICIETTIYQPHSLTRSHH
jgi:hypothetical protein